MTQNTRAIMPVHYASNPGDLDAIYTFAQKHNLRIIEDAAHAFGCYYGKKKIGSIGDIQCFSFDGIKNITSGEGGAIVTSDHKVASKIRDCRLLGVEKDTDMRYSGKRSWEFDVKNQGYRYHMSNICAAIGRVQLQRLENEFAPKRKYLSEFYRNSLKDIEEIKFLEVNADHIIPHIQPVRILDGKRDKLREHLERHKIQTGIHYKPNHLLSKFGSGKPFLPHTEMLYDQLLSLPLHPELNQDSMRHIIEVIGEFYTS